MRPGEHGCQQSSRDRWPIDEDTWVFRHTCSLLSSFFASLTFPMLPAPMVFPSIHFPDCVGIVVRDRPCFWAPAAAEAAALASATPWDAGDGPGLFADAAMSGWPGLRPLVERWLFRRWGCDAESVRDADGGRSLLLLRLE